MWYCSGNIVWGCSDVVDNVAYLDEHSPPRMGTSRDEWRPIAYGVQP